MYGCYPTKSRNSSTKVSYLSGRSQAFTLGVARSAHVWRMRISMRHRLAKLKKKFLEQSSRNNRIRGVIKKVARIHIMDSNTSRCWEPRRHQLRHAPYSSQMHSRSSLEERREERMWLTFAKLRAITNLSRHILTSILQCSVGASTSSPCRPCRSSRCS
jgi:hypothetical protein